MCQHIHETDIYVPVHIFYRLMHSHCRPQIQSFRRQIPWYYLNTPGVEVVHMLVGICSSVVLDECFQMVRQARVRPFGCTCASVYKRLIFT